MIYETRNSFVYLKKWQSILEKINHLLAIFCLSLYFLIFKMSNSTFLEACMCSFNGYQ